ncbi:hypothetical protein D3C81_1548010 [compost metagenome]
MRSRRPAVHVTGIHDALRLQHFIDAVVEQRRKPLEFLQRQVQQIFAVLDAIQHGFADDLVRLAERQTLVRQEVGDVGRVGEVLIHRLAHPLLVHLHRGDHRRKELQRSLQGSDRIEHAFLVFLHVLVVRQRQ